MVKGLDVFREYFKDYSDRYIIIGGTACDIVISAAGLTPRATKDIDVVLVVESLDPEFVRQFWKFIKDGEYGEQQKSTSDRTYYRFMNPGIGGFPQQVELFSRRPDAIDGDASACFTAIPVDDDPSSLSAILMDDRYYTFTLEHSIAEAGLTRAQTPALICLKAKAFLDLRSRRDAGERVDEKSIRKHKLDVFRLALLLSARTVVDLPEPLKEDMQKFVVVVGTDLPDQAIFKEMGAIGIDVDKLFQQLLSVFALVRQGG